MTDRFAQIILPQPGTDWKTYALALNAQLTRVIQQLARIQTSDFVTNGSNILPISNSNGRLIIDANGNIVDENGNIIIDATGLHVLDINDFKWIDGPNVYINTEKLVDNAVTTAKLAAQAVTADKFYGNLEPVEIVTVLPNPVGYTGPAIVLFNGKIYRYSGGAWVANVDTSDLTGVITETQIDNDSISTPKLKANAVTATNIAAGAILTDKLDAGAVTAAKLAAYSVVAGKLAANAIVANDGVIGTAAIVDAMIANLNASKINAGDIAAQRMAANIVQALVGKFAVLSAIVASLGTVTIGASGYLRTQGVTSPVAGTGMYLGDNGSGVYVLRVGSTVTQLYWDGTKLIIGNPTGGRWEFSGGSGAFINAAGETLFASGTAAAEVLNSRQLWSQVSGAADLGNLIPDVDFADTGWTLPENAAWSLITPWYGLPGKKAIRYDEQTVAPTGTFISDVMSPSAVNAPVTPGETVYWSYWRRSDAAANGTADFYIRFYDSAGSLISESGNSPTLPQASAGQHSGKAVVPALAVSMGYRFRRGSSAAGASTNGWVQWSQVRLSRTQDGATKGADIGTNLTRDGVVVAESDFVAGWNKLTASNMATYMAAAAIDTAYIKNAAVQTLKIGNDAVTVPQYSVTAQVSLATRTNMSIALGSITTAADGQGRVLISLGPFGAFPDSSLPESRVTSAAIYGVTATADGTFTILLRRTVAGVPVTVWSFAWILIPANQATWVTIPTHVLDTPGPGKACVYTLEYSQYSGNCQARQIACVLMEAKR